MSSSSPMSMFVENAFFQDGIQTRIRKVSSHKQLQKILVSCEDLILARSRLVKTNPPISVKPEFPVLFADDHVSMKSKSFFSSASPSKTKMFALEVRAAAQKFRELATEKKMDEICPICGDCDGSQMVLKCGHNYHLSCLKSQIQSKWSGPRVNFNFLNCAMCRRRITHPALREALKPYLEMEKEVHRLALEKVKEDDIFMFDEDCEDMKVDTKPSPDQIKDAMKNLAFYQCVDCTKIYCGGLVSCSEDMEIDVSSLRCQSCMFAGIPSSSPSSSCYEDSSSMAMSGSPYSVGSSISNDIPDLRCLRHGYKYAIFKCDSCCNIATFDCIYNHYCNRCHIIASQEKNFPCPGHASCPLGVRHPPNISAVHLGGEPPRPFVIGCLKCNGFDISNHEWSGSPYKF